MAETLLVGLDVGTTAIKAAVVAADGTERAHGRAPTPWQSAAQGTELDAVELLDAVWSAVDQALAKVPQGRVVGVGVASMGEAGVLVDAGGAQVAPVVAWHDTRDAAEVGELEAEIGRDRFAAVTGLPLRTQWSLTKHRWLVRNVPQAVTAARRFSLAEWVVRALSGTEASDQSLASRTGWLDLRGRSWWSDALEWSGLPEAALPALVACGEPLGTARGEIPDRLRGATVTLAGHDHQAAALGAGAVDLGDELDSCGSAEALVRSVPAPLGEQALVRLTAAEITVGWHLMPGRWCLLGATQGGLLLRRVLDVLGCDTAQLPALDGQALSGDSVGQVRVVDRDGVIDIAGIGDGASPGAVWRAAVDTATRQVAGLHQTMNAVCGRHNRLVVTGGWSHSSALLEAKRQLLGPVRKPSVVEAGARGAALLGGLAAGDFATVADLPEPATRDEDGAGRPTAEPTGIPEVRHA